MPLDGDDEPSPNEYVRDQVETYERSAFPDYAGYQTKTTRQIPVFVLEPA